MSVLTTFYVEKPCDECWNRGMTDFVIEAGPVDVNEEGLSEWRKTEEYVRDNLKVINPESFTWPFVKKCMWIECSGPVRELSFEQYVELYHSLKPDHSLPEFLPEG